MPAKPPSERPSPDLSEDEAARMERLGRERPDVFPNALSEIGFATSMMLSIIMAEYFISGFNVIVPDLTTSLNIPVSESVWPASAFALVAGAFFLLFGRLADMFGGLPFFLGGLAWHAVWALGAGFSKDGITLDVCRAFQGFGPAAFLPASLMLIAKTYRPGRRKNVLFSIYGACAPVGLMVGILMSGISAQLLTWRWYFWIGSILVCVAVVVGALTVPSDARRTPTPGVKMDWWGALAIVSALVLLVAAITQSSRAPSGWGTPYIIVLLVLGLVAAGLAVWVEGWVAEAPLLPFDLFKIKSMSALVVALLFSYGVLGTWLFYTTFYLREVLHLSSLSVVAWFVPFGLGGMIIPIIVGFFLHLVPGTIILVVAALAWVAAPLLISFATPGSSYWSFVFPAMICATIGVDTTYNISNIFITTSVVQRRQGMAGALVNSLMFLGNSFFLGWGDVVHGFMTKQGRSEEESYRIVLWYITGLAGVPLVLFALFVRVGTAKSELTADEKEALRVEV